MLWIFGEGRSSAGVNGTDRHGNGLLNLLWSSYLQSVSFTLGRANASPSNTQGGSPVRESRTPGSVRGVLSNGHSYRDSHFWDALSQSDVVKLHWSAFLLQMVNLILSFLPPRLRRIL
jgi:hypothetical protein